MQTVGLRCFAFLGTALDVWNRFRATLSAAWKPCWNEYLRKGLAALPRIAAQEHAPLLATCEADVALWYHIDDFTEYLNAQTAFFNDKTPNKTALSRLPVTEIIARHEEMGQCWSMTRRDIYHDADLAYMGIFTDREHDFLVRHNLMQQFRDEDAAGKR